MKALSILIVLFLLFVPFGEAEAARGPSRPFSESVLERVLGSGTIGLIKADTFVGDGSNLTGVASDIDTSPFIAKEVIADTIGDVNTTFYGDGSNISGISDSYVVDVNVSANDTHVISHNIGTKTPTVVTYSDTELPYSIVDVPVEVINDSEIVLSVGEQEYIGKVKITR